MKLLRDEPKARVQASIEDDRYDAAAATHLGRLTEPRGMYMEGIS